MLTKQLAKEAAILMCERSELNVIKVGRWRKDGQILKREFTCRHCKGHEFIVEITFDKTANHVYCKVFFNDADIDDFLPGRSEWDDEIEMELKKKFGASTPEINVELKNPTNDQALRIGVKLIKDLNFKIDYVDKWHGTVDVGFAMVNTDCGIVFITLNRDGVIAIDRHGENLMAWVNAEPEQSYDTDLQDRASKCLADMFLGSIFVYIPITNWTNQKNCMVSYLSIYDANKKYNGKAVLTADGVINIYANDKLIMSRNCLKEAN